MVPGWVLYPDGYGVKIGHGTWMGIWCLDVGISCLDEGYSA